MYITVQMVAPTRRHNWGVSKKITQARVIVVFPMSTVSSNAALQYHLSLNSISLPPFDTAVLCWRVSRAGQTVTAVVSDCHIATYGHTLYCRVCLTTRPSNAKKTRHIPTPPGGVSLRAVTCCHVYVVRAVFIYLDSDC